MTDAHSQPFFGKNTALFVQTRAKNEPFIFLKCIKIKDDDSWEKPSLGEGKTIKCKLEEIIMMLRVLNHKLESWTTVHIFKDNKTQISFNWKREKEDVLWINIGSYRKKLLFAQVEIFKLLLGHIIHEKIENATIPSFKMTENNELNSLIVTEEREGF
ncbi:hypothetical protein ES703_116459 [subsurface metagenome]